MAAPENFRLIDSDGNARTLIEVGSSSPVVVVAVEPGCPASRALANWAADAVVHRAPSGTRLLLLDPAPGREAARSIGSPVLMDDSQSVSRSFGFHEVGDFLVVDPTGDVVLAKGNLLRDPGPRFFSPEPAWRRILSLAPAKPSGHACPIQYRPLPRSLTPEIAGAVIRSCLFCHGEGSQLDLFQGQAAFHNWHSMNSQVMRMYRMPVGGVDYESPDCRMFRVPELVPGDLRLVQSWIDAGEPPADAGDPIAEARRHLAPPNHVSPKFHGQFKYPMRRVDRIEANAKPRYVFAIIAGPLEREVRVTGTRIQFNGRVTHHVDFFASPTPLQIKKGETFDRDITEDLAGTELVPLEAWAKGEAYGSVRRFPPGIYLPLPKGSYLGLVMHYEPTERAETNHTVLELEEADPGAPGKPIHTITLARQRFVLRPGQKDFVITKSWKTDHDVSIFNVILHGHLRLVATKVEIRRPGEPYQTLCNTPYQTDQWQNLLWPRVPHRIPAGSEVRFTLRYDNSVANPANPDSSASVPNGLFNDLNEMDLVRFQYVDGFLPEAQ